MFCFRYSWLTCTHACDTERSITMDHCKEGCPFIYIYCCADEITKLSGWTGGRACARPPSLLMRFNVTPRITISVYKWIPCLCFFFIILSLFIYITSHLYCCKYHWKHISLHSTLSSWAFHLILALFPPCTYIFTIVNLFEPTCKYVLRIYSWIYHVMLYDNIEFSAMLSIALHPSHSNGFLLQKIMQEFVTLIRKGSLLLFKRV